MKTVAEQQRIDNVRYRRVPVHEATSVGAMISAQEIWRKMQAMRFIWT